MRQADLEQALKRWLYSVGFAKGNPFADFDAYYEIAELPTYFQDTSVYDLIVGNPLQPETKIIFAPRGGGKTAHWVMLYCHSQPQNQVGKLARVLAVPHIRFERIWDAYYAQRRITSLDHLREILKYGTRNLLGLLMNDQKRANDFPDATIGRFRWFCDEFNPELLQVDSLRRFV